MLVTYRRNWQHIYKIIVLDRGGQLLVIYPESMTSSVGANKRAELKHYIFFAILIGRNVLLSR